MPRLGTIAAIAFSAVVSFASNAHADAAAEAAALLEQAEAKKEKGDWAAACPLYQRAYDKGRQPGALLRLAECAERQGDYALALERYEKVGKMVQDYPQSLAEVTAKQRAVEAKVGRAVLRLAPEAPPGTRLTLDGKPEQHDKVVIVVAASEHEACAEADGRQKLCRRFRAPAGQTTEVGPLAPAAAAPVRAPDDVATPPPPEGRGALFWAGVASTTVGGVGVIGIAVTGGLSLHLQAKADDGCADRARRTGCNQESLDAAELGKTMNIVNAISWGVGIAGLGAGIPMMIVGDGDSSGGAVVRLRTFHAGLAIESSF